MVAVAVTVAVVLVADACDYIRNVLLSKRMPLVAASKVDGK
jgi:hypothetical protein